MFYEEDGDYGNLCVQDYNYILPSKIFTNFTEDESYYYDEYDTDSLFEILGWYTGCMPINSLLQSTFECFYNQTCVDMLLSSLPTNKTFEAMTVNEESIYELNTSSIQSMVDGMMVEQYHYDISYAKYYNQCAYR
jgi:hypothetical protein